MDSLWGCKWTPSEVGQFIFTSIIHTQCNNWQDLDVYTWLTVNANVEMAGLMWILMASHSSLITKFSDIISRLSRLLWSLFWNLHWDNNFSFTNLNMRKPLTVVPQEHHFWHFTISDSSHCGLIDLLAFQCTAAMASEPNDVLGDFLSLAIDIRRSRRALEGCCWCYLLLPGTGFMTSWPTTHCIKCLR